MTSSRQQDGPVFLARFSNDKGGFAKQYAPDFWLIPLGVWLGDTH